jgi:hypothetical protein
MKSMKIVFSSFLIVVALVTLSSFVASFDSKAFARVCVLFIATKKRVQSGQADSIDPSELTNVSNWSGMGSPTEPPTGCNSGPFLCAICFDSPPCTLIVVINSVASYYAINGTFTHGLNIDPGGCNTRIYLKSTTTFDNYVKVP